MGGRGTSSGNTSRLSKLPQLEGSEKQVKWATDLRNNIIKVIEAEKKAFKQNRDMFDTDLDKEYYDSYKKNIMEAIKVTKAGAWIDGFKNFNEYHTKSVIDSLKIDKVSENKDRDKYLSNRSKIRTRLAQSSLAYESFVRRNKK